MKPKFLSLVAGSMLCLLLLVLLSGCGGPRAASLVNTVTFNLEPYQGIRLDYDAEDIHVLEGEPGQVVLKEFMNENNKTFYAKTTVKDGELLITEGKRPRRSSFLSFVELYIPAEYGRDLSLHSTSGTLTSTFPLNVAGTLHLDTTRGAITGQNITTEALTLGATNGEVNLQDMNATTLQIKTTNANTTMERITGDITYASKGGDLTLTAVNGSGTFTATGNGELELAFTEVKGDLTARTKNGDIRLTLPDSLEFKFLAATQEGVLDTSFNEQLATAGNNSSGIIGASPSVSVELAARNGNITVKK
jgi:hypothetical protein